MIRPIEPEDLAAAQRQVADTLANCRREVQALADAERQAALLERAREQAREDVSLPVWGYLLVASFFIAGIFVGKLLPWGFGLPL